MFEQILNVYSLSINLVALVISLLYYIGRPRRAWVYMIVFLLGNLLSNYYWAAYMLLMGDYPNVSSIMAYFGWDISYVPLVLLMMHFRSEGEKRFFSPLSLLPVPLNLAQFFLYLPFGGLFNNIWQGVLCTMIACMSLNSLLYYRKYGGSGAERPYVAALLLLFVFLEYVMWTSSCFDWPGEWLYPYNYASVAFFGLPLVLIWAVRKRYNDARIVQINSVYERTRAILPVLYVVLTIVCCAGGYLLALWMRGVLASSVAGAEGADPYSIIAVVLFVISCVLVLFSIAIMLLVRFGQKAAESDALRQAKAIAEQSNAAKSDFLASMSHEIRTPINAVLGMNEMVLRESLQARDVPPKDQEAARRVFADIFSYADNIESAGNSLLSIINDILDFSKIEAGRLDIVEGEYRLSSVLNDVSNMIVFKARDKGLDFSVDVDDRLPDSLYGDEVRVRQIVTNVLNNAVKYTREGSVRLTVRGEADAALSAGDEVRLLIAVEDTGIGIRPEDMDRLFQKFERVDLQANSTVEGAGLGLAITQRLLDMMGGSIEVRSQYGSGSVFTIALPQRVVSAEPVGDYKEKFTKSLQDVAVYREAFRAPEARILIVDDTRMNLTVAVNLLKSTEIRIDTALSGAEAIALTASFPYDVILMDQRMPEMDGTEAMRRIRAQAGGANRDTPFICLTADAVSGARERYLSMGFTDYLSKPIDSFALEQMLMKLLPAEKVTIVREEAPSPANEPPEGGFVALGAAGVDVMTGLRYSQGDADIYADALREYARGAEEKARGMQAFFEDRDWKNYSVLVHSLKGTSRLIGAAALSDMAAALEAAADAGDADAILSGHDDMMQRHAALVAVLREQLGGEAGAEAATESDDEIMEFMPE